ncbi:nitrogen regulation protein NR(II) [Alteromonas sp. a30]|uniref:nitrogen regulation protein NR(II) n=1 Tax=Alteromonas sp. a30 TaxID=2730917 RepID=UPI0022808E15|nr:nitrogen regulation protein NR(II) [Alteromonas sp. a30]MCY7296336.1 nitrogen regulation protein NR(II) [Alteromonas sp. a30]
MKKSVFNSDSSLLDSLATSVLVINEALEICYVNNAAEAVFELSRNQLVGHTLKHFIANDALNSERMLHALKHRESYTEGEVTLSFTYGKHCLVDVMVSVVDQNQFSFLLLEIIVIDQQRKLSQDTQNSAHQQAARELVRGLAHEIKNPLGGIRGAAQLLDRELNNEEQREFTSLIIEQSDRLRNMVDKLLGPNAVPNFKLQNIHRAIEQIRSLIGFEADSNVKVERDYDPSIPEIYIDSDMIQQAILNIARNALQAIKEDGQITFITRIQRQQMIKGVRHPLCIEIKIIDNGPGIPKEVKDTLFYPMVSTKTDGTGLGLSIAQSLVEHHKGKVEVESWPGHTEFSILLPINNQESNK